MKKYLLIMAFAMGFAFLPTTASAKKLVATIEGTIKLDDGRTLQYVSYNDGCHGYFFSDGSYFVYDKNGNIIEGRAW